MRTNTENPPDAISAPWSMEVHAIERDEKGRWVKGSSGNTGGETSTGQRVAIWFRKALEGADPADLAGRSKLQQMFENMFAIATNTSALHMKEATWAFNALMERAYGPPVKDRTELDAMRAGGVTVQILQLPAAPAQVHVAPALIAPEFEDGEAAAAEGGR